MAMNSKLIQSDPIPEADIQEPARTPFFIGSGVTDEKPFHPHQRYDGQDHAFASRFSARHGGGENMAFPEGSVRLVIAAEVVETNPLHIKTLGKAIFPGGPVSWCPDPDRNPNEE